jgi:hypothetical protein
MPAAIPGMHLEEAIEERCAAFQRPKLRDLHDLAQVRRHVFDRDPAPMIAVLKLWESTSSFWSFLLSCASLPLSVFYAGSSRDSDGVTPPPGTTVRSATERSMTRRYLRELALLLYLAGNSASSSPVEQNLHGLKGSLNSEA